MNTEIAHASAALARYLEKRGVSAQNVEKFRNCLIKTLVTRFEGHYDPVNPLKGSGYRCILVAHGTLDPVLVQVCKDSGIEQNVVLSCLPNDYALWIDPGTVCFKSGERGMIYMLYEDKKSNDFLSKAASSGITIKSPSKEPSPLISPASASDSLSPPTSQATLNGNGTWLDSQETW